jgi:hypothetical protein
MPNTQTTFNGPETTLRDVSFPRLSSTRLPDPSPGALNPRARPRPRGGNGGRGDGEEGAAVLTAHGFAPRRPHPAAQRPVPEVGSVPPPPSP